MGGMSDNAWTALDQLPAISLRDLFAAEPDRLEALVVEQSGIRFDFSKTHLSRAALAAFLALADQAGLAARRDAMFAGEIVNPPDARGAEHSPELRQGSP